ncbi:DUF1127 domain-containing protein [Actibacterium sp. D379-3]
MADVQHIAVSDYGFAQWLRRIVDVTRDELARRRVYRRTVSELSALNARDLADLGISRSMIRRLALEAAYGI